MYQSALFPDITPRRRCTRCGRRLTDPTSRSLGAGPVCRRRSPTRVAPAVEPMPEPERVPVAVPEPADARPVMIDEPADDEPFFAWSDPDPRVNLARKITEAIAAYRARRGREPTVVLVNAREAARDGVGDTIEGVAVRAGPVAMGVMYVRAE